MFDGRLTFFGRCGHFQRVAQIENHIDFVALGVVFVGEFVGADARQVAKDVYLAEHRQIGADNQFGVEYDTGKIRLMNVTLDLRVGQLTSFPNQHHFEFRQLVIGRIGLYQLFESLRLLTQAGHGRMGVTLDADDQPVLPKVLYRQQAVWHSIRGLALTTMSVSCGLRCGPAVTYQVAARIQTS